MADRPKIGVLSARQAAVLAIRDALRSDAYVMDRIRGWRAQGQLDGREAALAAEIGLGTLRHLITIEHVLQRVARFDERRTPPELRCILLSAAYQLIWLDRVPDFAAVDQAVSLARTMCGVRASGMVNAVLRSLGRAIAERGVTWRAADAARVRTAWDRAVVFHKTVLPLPGEPGADALLAAGAGENIERVRALVRTFGAEKAAQIAWASQASPALALHRNPLRCDAERFRRRIDSLIAECDESERKETVVTDDMMIVSTSAFGRFARLAEEGVAHIQDVTARAAALCVEAQRGERILDLCAAPGGKSIVIAQTMENAGEIVACDISAQRLTRVTESAARLGLTNIRCRPVSPKDTLADEGEFDAALLDAPCSNSGVIARRPEARLRLRSDALAGLADQQRDLLRRAALRVRPGGRLVYSTCSIEGAENERVVESFLRSHKGWTIEHAALTLPVWGPSPVDWRDGGYVARLRRRG